MTILCKICNEEFDRFIHWRHLKSHNIDSAEYKKMYGPISIPGLFVVPEERKEKISQSIKQYANQNPDVMKQRTQKAIQTKINNGYDFGSSMRGKKQTDYSKNKSRLNAIRVNVVRKEKSDIQILEAIKTCNLLLNNTISETRLELTCNDCQTSFTFTKQYFQPSKFKNTICPTCYPRNKPVSNLETELYNFVKTICSSAIQSFRPKYHDREIDIFIPDLNIGFEFNGLYWHSEEVLLSNNRSKTSDLEKKMQLSEKGIRLIQIFEDEWTLKKQIVQSRIANILNAQSTRIFARKCKVKKITGHDAAVFCNENHIMGKGRSNSCYGLFHNDELVSVMTFSKSNLSRKIAEWELNRFCSKLNLTVVGGASRLFAAFLKEQKPDSIVSYSDNRWSEGNLYGQLGFIKNHSGIPNYWYIKPNYPARIHRFNLRKTKDDNQDLTEYQNRALQGYSRIWDCGSSKWVWTSVI